MIDATSGITAQDTHIAGYILEANKSTVVLVNKWDAIEKDNFTMQQYTEIIRRELNFVSYVPILFISVKSGQRVDQVLPLALKVQEERLARFAPPMNASPKCAGCAPRSPHAPAINAHVLRHQVRSDPPTFMIFVNDPRRRTFYLYALWKTAFEGISVFSGTPIRIRLQSGAAGPGVDKLSLINVKEAGKFRPPFVYQ
jgi:GTP-binding protein